MNANLCEPLLSRLFVVSLRMPALQIVAMGILQLAVLTPYALAAPQSQSSEEAESQDFDTSKIPATIPDVRLPLAMVRGEQPLRVRGYRKHQGEQWYRGLTHTQWREQLRHASPEVRLQAIEGVTECASRYVDPNSRPYAPEWLDLLEDPDVRVRREAIWHGESFGPDLAPLLSKVKLRLDDPDTETRVLAIEFLARHHRLAAEAIPRLIELVDDPRIISGVSKTHRQREHNTVRRAAIAALAKFGPAAVGAKAKLLAAAQEPNDALVLDALNAMSSIAGDDKDLIALLVRIFAADKPVVSDFAMALLAEQGVAASAAVPHLLTIPQDRWAGPDTPVHGNRIASPIIALARIAPEHRATSERIKLLLASEEKLAQARAREASGYQSPENMLEQWLADLRLGDRARQNAAREAVIRNSRLATPRLRTILDSALFAKEQLVVLEALRQIGGLTAEQLPMLTRILETNLHRDLEESSDLLTQVLVEEISRLDPNRLVAHPNAVVRRLTLGAALMRLDEQPNRDPDEIADALRQFLVDADADLRFTAAHALLNRAPEKMALAVPIVLETYRQLQDDEARLTSLRQDRNDQESENQYRQVLDHWETYRAPCEFALLQMLPTLARFEPKFVDLVYDNYLARVARIMSEESYRWEYADADTISLAAEILASVSDRTLERTLELLRSSRLEERTAAARVAGFIGPDAKDAIPWLLDLIDSHEPRRRFSRNETVPLEPSLVAVHALAGMAPLGEELLAALAEKLAFDERYEVLSVFRAEPEAAVKALQEIAADSEITERSFAPLLEAFKELGPTASPAIPELLRRGKQFPRHAVQTARVILWIDPLNEEAIRLASEHGANPEEFVGDSLLALGGQDLRSAGNIPSLIGMLGTRQKLPAMTALNLLPKHLVIARWDERVIEKLQATLREKEAYANERDEELAQTVTLLGLAGEAATPALNDILDVARTLGAEPIVDSLRDVNAPLAAARATERLVGRRGMTEMCYILQEFALEAPDESIAALYELAKDGMSEGRDPYTNGATDALKALAGFGPRLEPQASKIVELLELESAGNEPLKQAITNLGPAAVPALTQAMVHSSRGVRNRTAAILKGPLSCYAATVRANIRSLPVDDETKATALSALASFPWD